MELPIQLKFFKKIELYQDFIFEEKKSKETHFKVWTIEKDILIWVRNKHQHIGSLLTPAGIKFEILEGKYQHEVENAIESLVQRGYATGNKHEGIKISKEGMLMAEVVSDTAQHPIFNKYKIFYWIVLITIFSGVLIVIAEALEILIKNIPKFLFDFYINVL